MVVGRGVVCTGAEKVGDGRVTGDGLRVMTPAEVFSTGFGRRRLVSREGNVEGDGVITGREGLGAVVRSMGRWAASGRLGIWTLRLLTGSRFPITTSEPAGAAGAGFGVGRGCEVVVPLPVMIRGWGLPPAPCGRWFSICRPGVDVTGVEGVGRASMFGRVGIGVETSGVVASRRSGRVGTFVTVSFSGRASWLSMPRLPIGERVRPGAGERSTSAGPPAAGFESGVASVFGRVVGPGRSSRESVGAFGRLTTSERPSRSKRSERPPGRGAPLPSRMATGRSSERVCAR
jgi:hypothetical protein